jgi:hypothetical protein
MQAAAAAQQLLGPAVLLEVLLLLLVVGWCHWLMLAALVAGAGMQCWLLLQLQCSGKI